MRIDREPAVAGVVEQVVGVLLDKQPQTPPVAVANKATPQAIERWLSPYTELH